MSRSTALLETNLEYLDASRGRVLTTLGRVDCTRLSRALPVRAIPSYRNQQHWPGLFWSATTGAHVPYESQLELARLWFADFAPDVVWIAAQPMRLYGPDDQVWRDHTPDFLLTRSDGGLLVVDVKPPIFANGPKERAIFDWTSRLCVEKGWDFEVWMDYDPIQLSNLRVIASGRRSAPKATGSATAIPDISVQGRTLREAAKACGIDGPAALSRIWGGQWKVDLSEPLSWDCVVQKGRCLASHVDHRT